ncbi:GntR family transcriptional regulator [Sulfitobacter porphyrae]|uniref:GntR family transcriptional regulator n=1 Tax=Sulfitobacter porphyrae TaxID=1246864 RepID=A0ABW2B734_9RHOB
MNFTPANHLSYQRNALSCGVSVCNYEYEMQNNRKRVMTSDAATQPVFRRKSLHEELIDAIREQIVDGRLTPGTKVPEKDLCAQYGVSRTPCVKR